MGADEPDLAGRYTSSRGPRVTIERRDAPAEATGIGFEVPGFLVVNWGRGEGRGAGVYVFQDGKIAGLLAGASGIENDTLERPAP